MKTLLGIKCFAFALLVLGVRVSLGLAQSEFGSISDFNTNLLSFLHLAQPDGHALLLLLANPGAYACIEYASQRSGPGDVYKGRGE